MGQKGAGSFDSLLLILVSDDSDESWINALKHFCSVNADAFSLPTEGKDAFLNLLLPKLSEVASRQLDSDPERKLISPQTEEFPLFLIIIFNPMIAFLMPPNPSIHRSQKQDMRLHSDFRP